MKKEVKYIFVTGGIVSGIGKGITAAAIGTLLNSRGISFFHIKVDPYLNRDAGTMNPYQHGEVFVLKDGTETDLDLGHYERFSGIELDRSSNFTAGAVYASVIDKERRGDFLGKTIQVIPHVTDEIKRRIVSAGEERNVEVVIVEIGGTVGDIEAEPFLEMARQLLYEKGRECVIFVHVVKIDYLFPSGEEKTKPIQQSVTLLRSRGFQPDFLIIRSKTLIEKSNSEKISLFTNVPVKHIIPALDTEIIYEVPLQFHKAHLDQLLIKRLSLHEKNNNLKKWSVLVEKMKTLKKTKPLHIALIGKYTKHTDAYISVEEALRHAALHLDVGIFIDRLDADDSDFLKKITHADGVLVPGGFGKRGVEGKIKAIQYAREKGIPFLGLCLGFQLAVIEFARNVMKLKEANTTEINSKTPFPVIDILPEQTKVREKGGTMRLGAMNITLKKKTNTYNFYRKEIVSERHRHRYEINPDYHKKLQESGLVFSGISTENPNLVDMIEITSHPFFIGTQAHPEFQSRFLSPHPLFLGFIHSIISHVHKFSKIKK